MTSLLKRGSNNNLGWSFKKKEPAIIHTIQEKARITTLIFFSSFFQLNQILNGLNENLDSRYVLFLLLLGHNTS